MTDNRIAIYRAWENDELLYVGLTINPGNRFATHSSESLWWPRATRIDIERLPADATRADALAIEAHAIRNEQPLFNVIGNEKNPNRRIRMPGDGAARGRVRSLPPELSAKIRSVLAQREEMRAVIEQNDAEFARLVRRGFEEKIPVAKMAEAAGVTPGRIYQVRDGSR